MQVGIDFDGVLAYNPFRVIRAPVTYVKQHLLGKKDTEFFIPQSAFDKWMWTVLHESSIFPSVGVGLLKELVKQKQIIAHLVTARYSFLQPQLYSWLKKNDLEQYFDTITLNMNDQQPHMYKADIISKQKFDYFIEDNLDIVKHIKDQSHTDVLWIYNVLDRAYPYDKKFPYLKKALEYIVS